MANKDYYNFFSYPPDKQTDKRADASITWAPPSAEIITKLLVVRREKLTSI